ncbi:MAG TPA: hypothetical protein VF908_04880, partial [Gemmatimonadaceae bacterium]
MITTFTGQTTMQRSAFYAFALPLFLVTTLARAQSEDRAERWRDYCERGWNNDRARFCELRTYTISPATRISVDGGDNGGVAFIGGLTDAGYRNLSLDDLQELRDHGVTPDFIASLRRFGFTDLTTGQLLEARDHGVTESFVEDFRDLGYTNLSLRDFVRMRDHGVTPEFARQQRSSNGGLISVQDLIRRRDRG